jgi:hypothetical protein
MVLIAACLMMGSAHAQSGGAWQQFPKITVIGADSDPRQPLIDEAVAFWNRTLEELGSGFRLGPVERISLPIPERALQALSQSIVGGARPYEVVESGERATKVLDHLERTTMHLDVAAFREDLRIADDARLRLAEQLELRGIVPERTRTRAEERA